MKNKISKMHLAYLAGFLDGEGCISLTEKKDKGRRYITPKIVLANTKVKVLQHIKKLFGGYLTKHKKLAPERKPVYYLEFQYQKALKLARLIYPFLILKRKQAEIYFQYEKTIMNPKDGPKLGLGHRTKQREKLKRMMHKLNKRGDNEKR